MTETQFTTEELKHEKWKAVPEYEGLYEVSNLGRVKSIVFRNRMVVKPRELIMRLNLRSQRYPQVVLRKNNTATTKKVHRLVAITFLDPPSSHLRSQVNHKDLNKTNNRVSNLEWLTPKENTQHAVGSANWPKGEKHWTRTKPEKHQKGSQCPQATVTEDKVALIKQMIVSGYRNCEIHKRLNVTRGVVDKIKHRETWEHVPWPLKKTSAKDDCEK